MTEDNGDFLVLLNAEGAEVKVETKGTCQQCKWWNEGRLLPKVLDFQSTIVGSCKRMPHTETKVEDDWCGEFQPR